MKADRRQIERALDTAAADYRMFLLYGPDESGSRALADRIAKSLGADAERIDLTGAQLKEDPARLADEAASISLFGGRRHIRVEPAGDEIIDAVEALMEAAGAANPVVVVAGALRKDAKIVKRALADPAMLAFASYQPEGAEGDRMIADIAREHGLRIAPDIARRLATATGNDRAVATREIEKIANYLDAAPDRPAEIGHETLEAIGADSDEGDTGRLVDAVLDGDLPALEEELGRLAGDTHGIPLVRAVARRLFLLADVRSGGKPRGIFWKDEKAVERQARRWTPDKIATALTRIADTERAMKASGAAGAILVDAELLAIGRVAQRMR